MLIMYVRMFQEKDKMKKISELQVQSEAKVQQERQRFVMCS